MEWNDGGVAQVAWRELTDYLRDADVNFLDPSRGVFGEIDVAEGYRHLAHLLSYAFDFFVDSDPERPMFVPIATKWKKLLGDNTDTVYYYTNIDGRGVYRIRGQRGRHLLPLVHRACGTRSCASSDATHRVQSQPPRDALRRRRKLRSDAFEGAARRTPATG